MAAWKKYCYCTNCGRPYFETEIRTGELVWTGDGSYSPSRHCINCDQTVCQPSPLFSLLFCIVMMCVSPFVAIFSETPGNWSILVPALFLSFLGLIGFRAGFKSVRECKSIYDRWVHKHGTNPDDWPKSLPEKSK